MKYFYYMNMNTKEIERVEIKEIEKIYLKTTYKSIHTVFLDMGDGSFNIQLKMTSDIDACLEYMKCFQYVGLIPKDDGLTYYNPNSDDKNRIFNGKFNSTIFL